MTTMIDARFNTIDLKIEKVEGQLTLIQWMLGVNMAMTLLDFGSLITLWARVGLR